MTFLVFFLLALLQDDEGNPPPPKKKKKKNAYKYNEKQEGSNTELLINQARAATYLARKMTLFNFCFSSCVLLLLACSWRTSTGLPVPAMSPEHCGDCPVLFKDLLLKITELLSSDVLCFGMASDRMMLSTIETVLACAPTLTQNSSCMMQRNSSFSESECLRNIRKDLAYYAAAFQSYLTFPLRSPEDEVALLSPILEIIKSLRKSCSLMPNGENDSSEEEAVMWGDDTFSNRQKMCKMMRGFHVRTITINRAMGYISSGDHRK